MSAIAGILRLDGAPAATERVAAMLDIMAYRAPDGRSVWNEGPVALGFGLLRTSADQTTERLGHVAPFRDLFLAGDIRLDYRNDLIAALRAPADLNDHSLVLEAYRRWGERCVEHLEGDFGFALWDAGRQALFCARDHFGVRPFVYAHLPGRLFAFASEIKALLTLPECPRDIDEEQVANLLTLQLGDPERSLYQAVRRLPPGHTILIRDGRSETRRYWEVAVQPELRLPDAEYPERYRELLTAAVRSRLRGDGPAGLTLSGGLDSSSLAVVAVPLLAEAGRGPLQTFSCVFDVLTQCDERPYINAVVDTGGMTSHYVYPERIPTLGTILPERGVADEPLWNLQNPITVALHDGAHAAGVRIVLDGVGGDQVVSHGGAFLTELVAHGRWLRFWSEARQVQRHFKMSTKALVYRYALQPFLPGWLDHAVDRWRGVDSESVPSQSLISPALISRTGIRERIAGSAVGPREQRSVRANHAWQLRHGMNGNALEQADLVAAKRQIQLRFPFFDRRLAEFCLALPGEQRLANGLTRRIARRALANQLPPEIRERGTKASFMPNLARTLSTLDRPLLEELAAQKPADGEAYVDVEQFSKRCAAFVSCPSPTEALWVGATAVIAGWLRNQTKESI